LKFAPKPLTFDEYYADIRALAQDSGTHFYFDTSFLMWLTGLGFAARADFLGWMDELGPQRFHVPDWSTHEYYRHHVNRQASENIETSSKKLKATVDDAYGTLLPAFCEGDEAASGPAHRFQMAARAAFRELIQFSEFAAKWARDSYDDSSAEVIEKIINVHGLKSGNMFRYLSTIGVLKDNRYSGRIPPGFQDKGKTDTAASGGNSAGDLMFWKEILDHAKRLNWGPRRKVKNVVILTNDGKTDWVRGGGVSGSMANESFGQIRSTWDPVPLVHPTLEYEISSVAKVRRVALLNGLYLGTIFLKSNVRQAFATAAVTTRLTGHAGGVEDYYKAQPAPPGGAPGAPKAGEAAQGAELPTASELSAALFLEPSAKAAAAEAFLVEAAGKMPPTAPWSDIVSGSQLQALTLAEAAWVGRKSMERASAGAPLALDHVQDLLAMLSGLPARTSCAIFAGALAAMYMETDGSLRESTFSTFLESLSRYQTSGFAAPAIEAVRAALDEKAFTPLYFPNVAGTKAPAKVLCTNSSGKSRLDALSINGRNVLDNTCVDEGLRLSVLVKAQKGPVTVGDVVRAACLLYAIPLQHVEIDSQTRQVTIHATQGFIDPRKLSEGEYE
jgi:hypothetical protein